MNTALSPDDTEIARLRDRSFRPRPWGGVMLNLCYLVGHHRSRRWARPAAGTWRSECQFCGVQMERIGPGHWLPVSDLPKRVARSESKTPVAE